MAVEEHMMYFEWCDVLDKLKEVNVAYLKARLGKDLEIDIFRQHVALAFGEYETIRGKMIGTPETGPAKH